MSARIVFFGTPQFAVPSLERLSASGVDIAAVVTAPDKPTGRRRILTAPPVKATAERLGIPVLQPSSLKEDSFFEQFAAFASDVCVIVAYGKILPERYLAVPTHGFVNVHPSLLPMWRGPSPIQAALGAGDRETGVSVMVIDAEMDHGPLLAQQTVTLSGSEHLPELSEQLADIGANLLVPSLIGYLDSELAPVAQAHENATYCSKMSRENARIRWDAAASETVNLIRANSGEPNAWTTWNGKALNIVRTDGIGTSDGAPGTVTRTDNIVMVATGENSVILSRVQLEGRTVQSVTDFINGHSDFVGSVLT